MRSTEVLALLTRGYTLRYRRSKQVVALFNPANEVEYDVPPEIIAELLSAGLISVSSEEPERVYSLTEKAKMLLSWED